MEDDQENDHRDETYMMKNLDTVVGSTKKKKDKPRGKQQHPGK